MINEYWPRFINGGQNQGYFVGNSWLYNVADTWFDLHLGQYHSLCYFLPTSSRRQYHYGAYSLYAASIGLL